MGLVTLDVAKDHLHPPGDVDDARIARIIKSATSLVLHYIKMPAGSFQDSNGDPIPYDGENPSDGDGVPPDVEAATLLVIGSLYDNADGQDVDKQPLSEAVKSLLHVHRVPTLA